MAAVKVLQIPELCMLIIPTLSLTHLVRLRATCRDLQQVFDPLIFTDFTAGDTQKAHVFKELFMDPKAGSIHSGVWSNNLQYLRSIVIGSLPDILLTGITASIVPQGTTLALSASNPQKPARAACPILAQLDIALGPDHNAEAPFPESLSESILQILRNSPHLSDLSLPADFLVDWNMAGRFIRLIPKLGKLSRLAFTPNARRFKDVFVPYQIALTLLQACVQHPALKTLHCNFTMTYSRSRAPGQPQDEQFTAQKVGPMFKAIESVSKTITSILLPKTEHGWIPAGFVIPFLENCVPELETLDVPCVTRDNTHTLASAVKEHCSKVRHLKGTHMSRFTAMDYDSTGLVIESLAPGLQTFECAGYLGYGFLSERLLQSHGATLVDIHLTFTGDIQSQWMADVLATCPNLETFVVQHGWRSRACLEFKHMNDGRPWICNKLKTLIIELDRTRDGVMHYLDNHDQDYDEDYDYDSPPEEHLSEEIRTLESNLDWQAARDAYAQLGTLTSLEELTLDYYPEYSKSNSEERFQEDLLVMRGNSCLTSLSGLKKLKRLTLDHEFAVKMGQKEVEFMVENWKKLEQLTLDGDDNRLLNWREFEWWRWLQQQRPELTLVARCSNAW